MDFLKKHPLFIALVAVCLLAFAAGVYLLLGARAADEQAARALRNAEQSLHAAARGEIAPTQDNLALAEANIVALRGELDTIRERLESGVQLQTTDDPVQLITRIQRFISQMRRTAEAEEVRIPANFGFGFDRYVEQSTPPAQPFVVRVDKQRLVLEYLLGELIASGPSGITRVQRETIEVPQTDARGTETTRTAATTRAGSARTTAASGDAFRIDPAISARVPNAIDSLAFRITFTGFTESLQTFINRLAAFEYPIVIRSIEVARPAPARTTGSAQRPQRTQTIEDIFGGFGGGSTQPTQTAEPAQRPVIEDNESEFTLVLEFIELTLPRNN
jgi:hypothetical protein